MADIFLILISTCLVNNLILDGMLGVAPAMALSKKVDTATGLGVAMIFILTVTALVSYPLNYYLLVPQQLEYLRLLSFVITIAISVYFALRILALLKPRLTEEISLFLPLALLNTAVLGAALLNIQNQHGLLGALFFGVGSGLGFMLLLPMLAAMQERIHVADIPQPFRGSSILLITLGIISMAFMGFIGLGVNG